MKVVYTVTIGEGGGGEVRPEGGGGGVGGGRDGVGE